MKELSIKEKAKAYDEALKVIKECVPDKNGFITIYPQEIFPELAESEDERVRKTLIRFHKSTIDVDGIKGEDIIDWLEKQGKQEDILENAIIDNNEDGLIAETIKAKQGKQKYTAEEVLIKAGLKPYKDGDQWCILLGDNIQEGICGFGDTVDEALYKFLKELLEKQGGQKPADEVEPKFKKD